MNAEQIRADAIECIARAEWDAWKASLKILDGEPADADYAEAPDDNVIKVALRQQATRDVDALAAAGLLPTRAEKRAVDGGVVWTHGDGGRSTLPVFGTEHRYVTEWQREVAE